jgi:TRAP-type C4-dicarboxylate transport system substrate-binding protein
MKLIRFFAGAALATAVLAIPPPAAAQVTTLRIESILPATHATSRAMEIFKAELERRSGDSIEVEVLAGSQRGLKELIDAVYVGGVFATWTGIGNFSRVVPEIEAVSLPFISENYDQARRTIAPVMPLITTKLDAKGFTVLAWTEQGPMQVSNSKRPLKTLEDFKGLNIRVLPNATHLATFQALGARPVAMDLKDVDAALRHGDIDGQEQDYATIYANRNFESQKYLSDTRQFLDFHVLAANKSAFASLNPMQQKAVREAATIAAVQQRKLSTAVEATALARLQELGMQFDPLSRETRAALRRATASVIDDVKKGVGADVVNKVLAANGAPAAARVPAAARPPTAARVPTGDNSHR